MLVRHDGLIWAALALIFEAGLSLILELGLARSILWAAIRSVLQLSAVGVALSWLFQVQNTSLSLGVICLMTFAATHTVLKRIPNRRNSAYNGFSIHVFLSLAASAWIFSIFAGSLVLTPGSWRKPEVVLPFAGLLLGNSISGISLGLSQWVQGLNLERELIETRLAFGASSWEAVLPVFRQSLTTAMTPILNSMTVAGIVSLPGMMTGQLLAGADPSSAVQYQIAALFLIASSTFFGVISALFFGYRSVFNFKSQFQRLGLNDQTA